MKIAPKEKPNLVQHTYMKTTPKEKTNLVCIWKDEEEQKRWKQLTTQRSKKQMGAGAESRKSDTCKKQGSGKWKD